jgi:hypothetical protein
MCDVVYLARQFLCADCAPKHNTPEFWASARRNALEAQRAADAPHEHAAEQEAGSEGKRSAVKRLEVNLVRPELHLANDGEWRKRSWRVEKKWKKEEQKQSRVWKQLQNTRLHMTVVGFKGYEQAESPQEEVEEDLGDLADMLGGLSVREERQRGRERTRR